ncbi:putative holin-like toxin [Listeria weihenstephanensis]|uniref:Putative holin-like toxin n=1 Tax=Listeria weihenstephanensis TaxID=1006155 RepID=A0A841Z5L1_9LIST|nr:putative holin-like toxin [Listeria weihenstephanensis]MBC1500508.1 putative holin-like toxin [Listeria weihenstephanensis]
MSVAEAMALMLGFGSFIVSFIGLIVVIVKAMQKDKE